MDILADANQLQLTSEQIDAIETILADAENRIRDVLTERQLSTLDDRPRGRRGGRRGPR